MGMDDGQRRSDAENGLGNVTRRPYMDVIVDEELRHASARPGDRASSRARGHIPLGYYNDPEKTAKTFVTSTACAGCCPATSRAVEADGSITVFGRGSSCINSGGEKIFPEEVEQALKAHPACSTRWSSATPDERWGQHVAAVIAPRGDGARRWRICSTMRASTSPATRCRASCTSSTRSRASRAASRTTRRRARSRWPARTAPADARAHHNQRQTGSHAWNN